ncbi:MAG: cbb3-type cytochrome c oxidase subunit I [Waddliaceae bacterium]
MSAPIQRETPKEKVIFDDTPVKFMLYPALIFMILGMTIGTFLAFNAFVFPDYFQGEYIHFGRLRPVHVGNVLFLWLISAGIGFFYYFIPRLCGIPLYSSKLANLSTSLWWFSLIIGIYSFPFGTNSGWEYAELPAWVSYIPIRPLFYIAWLMVVANVFLTIANRRFEKMYVSLWYAMGTCVWASFTIFAGTYGINWVPGGVSRVNVNFFYVHNLVGLIFTPLGLATVYYFLPKIANTPIHSHRLSMVGFWSLAFFYGWIGAHHYIHGPISQWLQTTSIVFSIWLFIPVWSVVHNLFFTLAPQWKKYTLSVPIRFLIMGTMFYLITCIQGPIMALRNVNEITSKTDWVIGHSHIALYGTFTFFAIAGIYQCIPTITRKPLWSNALSEWHFNLNMIGSVFFLLSLTIGGVIQGLMWASWADGSTYAQYHINITQLSFIDSSEAMRPWWIMRAVGGLIILIANLLFIFNIFNTIVLKPRDEHYKKRAYA